MINQNIAHYHIAQKLGAGGMGVVYRARDERLQRDVALKLLPADAIADDSARLRLLNEARSASALNHPHICTIYEVGEDAGRVYIAMEHVEGSSLSALIPADGLPAETVLRYGAQIADALAHAHERGIVHRDLKSSNLMVRPEGRVKILDFGLAARMQEAQASDATRSKESFAEQGVVVGTLHYMAPEILRGEPASARSDIWALGVVLYEMAAGELPFQGQTGFEVSAATLRESPAPLPAHIPEGLRAAILRCLAKDPAQRYQSASEVRTALETLQSEKPTATRAHSSRRMLYQARTELRGKWKFLVVVAASVFLGAGVGISPDFWGDPAKRMKAIILLAVIVPLLAAVIVAAMIFLLKRWSFVVYPDKIRVKGKRRSIDIPFDKIEAVEFDSFPLTGWNVPWDVWRELKIIAAPGFTKLGIAGGTKFRGQREVVKVTCGRLGRRRGYYLDMDNPRRFFDTLNRALERYRVQHKSSAPQVA
jgi:tRNA A-37 threonylcarbamoyl transferase component Bud32